MARLALPALSRALLLRRSDIGLLILSVAFDCGRCRIFFSSLRGAGLARPAPCGSRLPIQGRRVIAPRCPATTATSFFSAHSRSFLFVARRTHHLAHHPPPLSTPQPSLASALTSHRTSARLPTLRHPHTPSSPAHPRLFYATPRAPLASPAPPLRHAHTRRSTSRATLSLAGFPPHRSHMPGARTRTPDLGPPHAGVVTGASSTAPYLAEPVLLRDYVDTRGRSDDVPARPAPDVRLATASQPVHRTPRAHLYPRRPRRGRGPPSTPVVAPPRAVAFFSRRPPTPTRPPDLCVGLR